MLAEDITVNHEVQSINTSPVSPDEQGRNNVFSIFSNGFDHEGSFISYATGTSITGAAEVVLDSGNSILQISRLGTADGVLKLGDNVVIADVFASGIGVNNIHFDIHSNFETGIDVLKLTLVDTVNDSEYTIDGIELTDGEWVSFDYNLVYQTL